MPLYRRAPTKPHTYVVFLYPQEAFDFKIKCIRDGTSMSKKLRQFILDDLATQITPTNYAATNRRYTIEELAALSTRIAKQSPKKAQRSAEK